MITTTVFVLKDLDAGTYHTGGRCDCWTAHLLHAQHYVMKGPATSARNWLKKYYEQSRNWAIPPRPRNNLVIVEVDVTYQERMTH